MLKRTISDESGRALILVLIILCLGALLIPTFLSHSSTNLFAARVTEEGLKEQYAADSGIEYALWRLQTGVFTGTTGYGINTKEVDVTWTEYISPTYVITSTATSDDGSSTTIVSFVQIAELDCPEWPTSPVFDNAIASDGSLEVKNRARITGDIYAHDNIELKEDIWVGGDASSATGTITLKDGAVVTGTITDYPPGVPALDFPEIDAQQYKDEADPPGTPVWYGDVVINSDGEVIQGPADFLDAQGYIKPYRIEGKLEIKEGAFDMSHPVHIGPLYVTEKLEIKKNNTVVLEGTVYVGVDGEGDFEIKENSTITGSGGIVAEGKIELKKGFDYSVDRSFLISVYGDIECKENSNIAAVLYAPNGHVEIKEDSTIRGAVAGQTVEVKEDCVITYDADIAGQGGLPGDDSGDECGGLKIITYNINP